MVARPGRSRVVVPLAAAAVLLAIAPDCATATAIEVEVYSDTCQGGGPVGFAGGASLAELGTGAYASVSEPRACDAASSRVGRVVLSPSGSRDAKIAFEVVTRADGGAPERCSRASYAGCIVARRQLPFLARSTITMRVDLRRDCLDVPCSELETCVRGRCVSADTQCDGTCDDAQLVTAPPVDAGTDTSSGGPADATPPPPIVDASGLSIVDIASGAAHTCVLWSDGVVQCWGDNSNGQISEKLLATVGPTTLPLPGAGPVRALGAGGTSTCVVLDPPTGLQCRGGLGAPMSTGWQPVALPVDMTQVVVGHRHACARDLTGATYCWGANDVGQLGGTTPGGTGFVKLGQLYGRLYAGAMADHTCGVAQDGMTYSCWSSVAPGGCAQPTVPVVAIGLAPQETYIAPKSGQHIECGSYAIGPAFNTLLDVSGRAADICTLDDAGNVICHNSTGLTARETFASARRISSGGQHTCVLAGAADVTCFGSNAYGQLGGAPPNAASFKPVLGRL